MKRLITLLLILSASAVPVVASPYLQSRSESDIVQIKRQVEPRDDSNCYPFNQIMEKAIETVYAYNQFAALVYVYAYPEAYGTAVIPGLLTNLTFMFVNYLNGDKITLAAHYGTGLETPKNIGPATYFELLIFTPLIWPINMNASEALAVANRNSTTAVKVIKGAQLTMEGAFGGFHNTSEAVWGLMLEGTALISVGVTTSKTYWLS